MSADQLIQYLSWSIYLVIFLSTAVAAVRRPLRANVDIALLFAATALVIVTSGARTAGIIPAHPLVSVITVGSLLAMAYMLVRLTDDFATAPAWLLRAAAVGLALAVVANLVLPVPAPAWLGLAEITYMVVLLVYVISVFTRESRRTNGVTQRRMSAVAAGCLFLVAAFLAAGLRILLPQYGDVWTVVTELCGLASGVSYFVGFAPPGLLRRAWQEPELRAFLGRAAHLPRLPDTQAILEELERGASTTLGAPHARIGLWQPDEGVLHYPTDPPLTFPLSEIPITAQALESQHAVFSDDVRRLNSTIARAQTPDPRSLLAAPITAGTRRLGVLAVYSTHAPIFAEEDLALVQLLADQAAVVLESRALIDEATRVRALEAATRMKEDFLSAAAHDLKTPLTTLVAQAQLLERKVRRAPDAPADLAGIQKIIGEALRLKTLVLELLDAARTEQGQLVSNPTPMDLVSAGEDVCVRHTSPRHPCS
ncbi:MAG TPA: GAF domain-containing protein, partial [Chloroflexia bacterium]|nr:GAF domain-containing protein [Chloroflexia bacterium]